MALSDYQVEPFTNHQLGEKYTVERVLGGGEADFRPAYIVTGRRGAKYTLQRNVNRPDMMFSINANSFLKSGLIAGHEWFTDRGGELRAVRT